jgi:hypothetical protein
MPLIQYLPGIKQKPSTEAIIDKANEILQEYEDQGFDLTLRQLYYQFVSRDLLANKQTEYKRLGSIVNDARLLGLIDWDHITDRTRNLQRNAHWDSPADAIESMAWQYRIDLWAPQSRRVEVWIEKDALIGVIEGICTNLDVPYFSCRGYTSQSEMWRAAMRMKAHKKPVTVLHLGDHDPSGMDMTRDIRDRLKLLSHNAPITVKRIALNMDQIQQYDPPPNPAKVTDSRATAYIEKYGNESWELDALEPAVMTEMISNEVTRLRNQKLWRESVARHKQEREALEKASENWTAVEKFLKRKGGKKDA